MASTLYSNCWKSACLYIKALLLYESCLKGGGGGTLWFYKSELRRLFDSDPVFKTGSAGVCVYIYIYTLRGTAAFQENANSAIMEKQERSEGTRCLTVAEPRDGVSSRQDKPFQPLVITTRCRQQGSHYVNSHDFPLFPVWKMQKSAWLSPRHSLCHLCGLHMFMQMEE